MNAIARHYANWVVRHKWLTILLTLILVIASAAGAKRLTMSGDYKIFFKPDNPQLLAFEATQKTYTKSDNILLVLAPKDKDVFTRKNLAAVIDLTPAPSPARQRPSPRSPNFRGRRRRSSPGGHWTACGRSPSPRRRPC